MDRSNDLVLDLSPVRHLDAVAVVVIAVAADRLREAGRELIIQGASRRQERTMRRRGLLIPQPRSAATDRLPQRGHSAA